MIPRATYWLNIQSRTERSADDRVISNIILHVTFTGKHWRYFALFCTFFFCKLASKLSQNAKWAFFPPFSTSSDLDSASKSGLDRANGAPDWMVSVRTHARSVFKWKIKNYQKIPWGWWGWWCCWLFPVSWWRPSVTCLYKWAAAIIC